MRTHENYMPLLATALAFTLAVLAAFQIYLLREPARVAADTQHDQAQAVAGGQALFAKSCATCHGADGAGDIGPALNDKQFLANTANGVIFSLISSGVPGSQMPAWNQAHGGPLTDEDVAQLVAFIRAWEPAAPDRQAAAAVGDPNRGAVIFNSVCFICHGTNGAGTARAPALNDPALLGQFDDAWFRATITAGRPAQGMPTWGTVLSPQQITDVLALLDSWRAAAGVAAPTGVPAAGDVARPSNPGGPGPALALTGDPGAGQTVFEANCQKCHGPAGQGGVANPGSNDGTIPPLNPIDSSLMSTDRPTYVTNLDLFIEHGSTPSGSAPKEKMPAWGDTNQLTPQQIADVISYVISLNKP